MKLKYPKTILLVGIMVLTVICLWGNHVRILYRLLDTKVVGKWQPNIALWICNYLKNSKKGVELAIKDLQWCPLACRGYTERILLESSLDCVEEQLKEIIDRGEPDITRHKLARANIIMAQRTHKREYVVNLYHCVKEPYDTMGWIRGDRDDLCRLIRMKENDAIFKKLCLKESDESLDDVDDNEIITIWEKTAD